MRDYEPVHCESCGRVLEDDAPRTRHYVAGHGAVALCAACGASECPLCCDPLYDGTTLAATPDGLTHNDCLTHAMEWAADCADSDHGDYESGRSDVLGYGKAGW